MPSGLGPPSRSGETARRHTAYTKGRTKLAVLRGEQSTLEQHTDAKNVVVEGWITMRLFDDRRIVFTTRMQIPPSLVQPNSPFPGYSLASEVRMPTKLECSEGHNRHRFTIDKVSKKIIQIECVHPSRTQKSPEEIEIERKWQDALDEANRKTGVGA
jgi:hypothetical protein